MKVWKYLEIVLLVVSAVIFAVFFMSADKTGIMLDGYLGWAYILLATAAVTALAFPLVNAFKSKSGLKALLLLIVGLVVVFGGMYLLAPGTPIEVNTQVTDSVFKFTDTALYITYLFIGASVLAIVWSIVRNAIKK